MKIAVAGDHRGYSAVAELVDHLKSQGHEASVLGRAAGAPCDYPEPSYLVAQAVAEGRMDRGILVCGTGIGVCMAANKVKGIRAALVHDELTAAMSRSHNDANVLCLSADLLGQRLIEKITDVFLSTPFEGGRHARRVRKIHAIEEGIDPAALADEG